jgi:riboflavin synthase
MFTGIVEEMGRVTAIERREGATRIEVECAFVHEGTRVGDSIALNGVCLTAVLVEGRTLAFEAVPETLRRTNLGALDVESPVNLERAVSSERTFGGHYVQGHVDGTATVEELVEDGEACTVRFELAPELARFLVPKGYVCVDGASLTVVEAAERSFTVTLVPHTRKSVVLGERGPGYVVNIEVDVMAKYVERLLDARLEAIQARLEKLEG